MWVTCSRSMRAARRGMSRSSPCSGSTRGAPCSSDQKMLSTDTSKEMLTVSTMRPMGSGAMACWPSSWAITFSWVSRQPLGLPVEPEV